MGRRLYTTLLGFMFTRPRIEEFRVEDRQDKGDSGVLRTFHVVSPTR